jgi:hypothetical protein
MTKETIEILRSLKTGEIYGSHKPIGKQEIEEQKILSTLHRMNVLKLFKNTYSVGNTRYLSKFIELQDFEKLDEYIEKPNESENGIKSIVNNGILIQDSLLEKSPIKQKTVNKTEKEPSKKSLIEIASLVIGSIIGLIGIWEFIIKKLL